MKARSKTQFHLVRSKKLKAADDKIKECRLLLTQYCQTISKEKKLAILNAMAYEIVEKITIAKEWTCLEVVCVYSERALDVHEQVNCLTEIMIKEAIEAAIQKDEQFKRDGKSTGILHGVPISLKDTVNYEGFDSTIGMSKFCFFPHSQSSPIVDHLLEAGCIPFVKTNVPQSLLSFECGNPVWGKTLHPKKKEFTCGGSSGGEAALLALNGSPLGIGSDVGGSLRIPSHFCGIYSLKPSYGRISTGPYKTYREGQESVKAVAGPMARSVKDLELFMRSCVNKCDPSILPMPFVSKSKKVKLKIAYATKMSFVPTSPACERAVLIAVSSVKKQGHKVFEFVIPDYIDELLVLMYGFLSADGGKGLINMLSGEPIEKVLESSIFSLKLTRLERKILSFFISDPKLHSILMAMRGKSADELWQLQSRRTELSRKFHEHWMSYGDFDCLIFPAGALPAIKHDTFDQLSFAASYTFLWNLLDYSVGSIPVTCVDAEKDAWPSSFVAKDALSRALHAHYDVKSMDGLDVGVQIVCQKYHEEQVLNCMEIVDSCLKNSSKLKAI